MQPHETTPWYQRTYRWGQTNITEADTRRYDIDWWRQHWRRTQVQGVILNAGGIVAYYPSRFALHYRAQGLGERDLYGELVSAARAEGLTVLARMDSNRATAAFYQERRQFAVVVGLGFEDDFQNLAVRLHLVHEGVVLENTSGRVEILLYSHVQHDVLADLPHHVGHGGLLSGIE